MTTMARILIVEDDPNDVELTLTALADYNLANEVVVTRDGQQALDYLYCRGEFNTRSADNPAVVLLDLKLPKVDGLEVLQQIKSDEHLKMIPVVVLTSAHAHDSPHFHTTPKVSANTGSSASIAANRSISGNSRPSGILGIRS
jgi:CheY-like chemotaxis protein